MEFFKIRNDIPFMRHALAFNVCRCSPSFSRVLPRTKG